MERVGGPLPPIPAAWEETRATLHAYTRAIAAITRVHARPHPRWWQIAMTVTERGLESAPMALPDGGSLEIALDLESAEIVVAATGGARRVLDMTAGASATLLGEELIGAVGALGLTGDYDRERFAGEDSRPYDRTASSTMRAVFSQVNEVFEMHRAAIGGEAGPVHLWPHNFDLALEWYGTRMVPSETDGDSAGHPAQLNLGFFPGDEPYFYSNPWPFDEGLTSNDLPHGAVWHVDEWQGTKLDYALVAGDPAGLRKLSEYALAVYRIASPSLMAS